MALHPSSTEGEELQMGEKGADRNSPALGPHSPCRLLSLVTRFFHRDLECGDPILPLPCTQQRDAQVDPSGWERCSHPAGLRFCHFPSLGSKWSYQGNRLTRSCLGRAKGNVVAKATD